jgi:indolepyruvate ferredoxin oxidoreductase alpha subunit
MNPLEIASETVGRTLFLMGNQALARGAIEANVKYATGYPGTPSSEVIESLIPVAKKLGMKVEWAVNEKVALEIAAGVAFTGLRSLVTMKNAGLNVAADPLLSVAYSGVDGGLVIYVADDPSCHSGMAEQDSRFYASLSLLPMLEPSNPQEAKDTIVSAFSLSEQLKIPVMIRMTTRVAHASAIVKFNPILKTAREPVFKKDVRRHARASPIWCMEQHTRLNNILEKSEDMFQDLPINQLIMKGEERYGVIATGVAWNYLMEVVRESGISNVALMKIGVANPLPKKLIIHLLENRKAVLVLEELEPYIELKIKAIASEIANAPKIHGKLDGTTPRIGEFSQITVRNAVGQLIGKDLTARGKDVETIQPSIPVRHIPFCPGCPHMGTYLAINRALNILRIKKDEAIVTGDIGCTILGMNRPFESCWTEVCMGASISVAAGLRNAGIDKPIIATIGDSTFFHTGLPALANLVFTNTRIVVIVLDNQITAMTGQQPSPASPQASNGQPVKTIDIEDVARSMGIESTRVVDPFNVRTTTEAIVDAINFNGPSVVVSRRTCALDARRRGIIERLASINPEKCTGCLACVKLLGCPALVVESNGKVGIDTLQCNGCNLCATICPYKAITAGKWNY